MGKSTQYVGPMEEFFGPDRLTEALRGKVREMILTLAEAELMRWRSCRMSARVSVEGIVTASGRDGSARDWERR